MMNKTTLTKLVLRMVTAMCLLGMIFSRGVSTGAKSGDPINPSKIKDFQQVLPDIGWILFDGKLYWTNNNGSSWVEITPSNTDIQAVKFLDTSQGWVIASDGKGFSLYSTTDGGASWQNRSLDLPGLNQLELPIARVLMDWRTSSHGWLVFKLATGNNFSRGLLFITKNGGLTWTQRDIPLGELVEFSDELNGRVSGGPAGDQAFITQDGGKNWEPAPYISNEPALSDGFVAESMSTPRNGWAMWQAGDCSRDVCVQEVKLLSTRDDSLWVSVRLPDGQTSLRTSFPDTIKASFLDNDTLPYQGQGFDTCEIPTPSQLQIWWNSSPYSAVNLYIGGISRGCSNLALSPSLILQLNAQGWRFFPTWVGLQAACTGYAHRMSFDVTEAYNEGVAEANLAVNAAQALGLTESDGSGTVIYFDLEAYNTNDQSCRNAANAFIDGWTSQLRARGNLAGVYGAAYASAVSDWWTLITNVPDAVWIAHWVEDSFTPDASVFGSSYVNDAYWTNHQRLRQYAGGHNETWGGQTINIDSNVLDGPLTIPQGTGEVSNPSMPSNPYPADGASITRTSDTWLRWKTTGDTCSIHVWGGTLNITAASPCSLYHLGVQAPGTYSWQITATNMSGSTTGPVWQLNISPAPPTNLTAQTVSSTRVDLSWTASIDPIDTYLVFMDGVQIASVSGSITSYQVQNLACMSTHSFQVKAVLSGSQSEPGNTASATTTSCAPVLISPVGGLAESLRPAFSWEPVLEATQYQIQVSTVAAFSPLSINARTAATSYTHSYPLLANRKYYWRVRAYGPFGWGDWGSSSFTTPNPPPAPFLISPVSNRIVYDYTPRLDWRDVTAPVGTTFHHYQVQVASDAGFTILIHDENVVASEFTPLEPLPSNARYYWRVRSVNTLGQVGVWSATGIFRAAILQPVLLSPPNGSILTTLRPTFTWMAVTGASSYNLQISTSSTFTLLLLNTITYNPTYIMPRNLPQNRTLFWRVRANGAFGPSQWSLVFNFTTVP